MNRRRKLAMALAASAFAAPFTTFAQSRPAPVVIAWLSLNSREAGSGTLAAFKEGLAALGWKEGSQFVIEERWANGQYERLAPLAAELAAKNPAIFVAGPSQPVAAAAKAAPRTPIVHATGSDPVAAGFAASLARPGGMITGLSNLATDITEKHLELLLAFVPKVRRVGFLTDARNVNLASMIKGAERSVAQRAIEARFAQAARADEIEPAMARLAKEGVQALVVFASPLFSVERRRIVTLALARRWPMIGPNTPFADAGALLSYGADAVANFRRAATFVDKILKGAKPGDLPMEQPTRLDLVVNATTAKALGLAIPHAIEIMAIKVIE